MATTDNNFRDIMELDALPRVQKPGRYSGGERNCAAPDWNAADVRIALCFPEVYEIGMSNLGFLLLYHLLNDTPATLCDRAFAPWPDFERELDARGLPLCALETRRPLADFDVVGFSLSYEMTYTNVLTMLHLGGLPLRAADRDAAFPLVIAGGGCACNPEPLADFIDAFAIGEGEEIAVEIASAVRAAKKSGVDKKQLLESLARIPGVYVPALCETEQLPDGRIAVGPAKIERRFIRNLDRSYYPDRFIVPTVEAVHDRIQLEIFRGCVQGCRYCQAGILYRPMRERSAPALVEKAHTLYGSMGCEEISLLSLNAADYSGMGPLLEGLLSFGEPNRVSVSLPSSRVDTFSADVGEKLRRTRATGLTLAPEAGTQRLRDVINKRITEDEIMRALDAALAAGWKKIKLYFMVGLPTETMEDVEGIVSLVGRMCARARSSKGKSAKTDFTLSVSNFVPKPHTPFQWDAMDTMETLREKQRILKRSIDRRRVKLDCHNVETSFLEGVLSRGDRRLGRAIEAAWRLGCRFDGWTDMFSLENWTAAFESTGVDPREYANVPREPLSRMPWSHIDTGVADKFLFIERRKAMDGETTPTCLRGLCAGCGLACKVPK